MVVWCLIWFVIQDMIKCLFLWCWHHLGKTGAVSENIATARCNASRTLATAGPRMAVGRCEMRSARQVARAVRGALEQ